MSQYSGGSMKKFAVALLSLAGVLAITPVASADSYTFAFSGPVNTTYGANPGNISFNAVFTTTPAAGDSLNITGVTGTYSNSGDGLAGTLGLYDGNATNASPNSDADGTAVYDNVFYPNNDAPSDTGSASPFPKTYVGGYFDNNGLLMTLTDGSTEYLINFWANENISNGSADYNLVEIMTNCNPSNSQCFLDEGNGNSQLYSPGSGEISSTPEPSSLLLLGSGLLGLAFIVYRKQIRNEQ
jgi:hypothetical protein